MGASVKKTQAVDIEKNRKIQVCNLMSKPIHSISIVKSVQYFILFNISQMTCFNDLHSLSILIGTPLHSWSCLISFSATCASVDVHIKPQNVPIFKRDFNHGTSLVYFRKVWSHFHLKHASVCTEWCEKEKKQQLQEKWATVLWVKTPCL